MVTTQRTLRVLEETGQVGHVASRQVSAVISRWVMESRRVEREYLDEELRRLATESGFSPNGWSAQEISDFRVLVQCARAAQVERDLRRTRMLRIESDEAGDSDRAQATLGSGRVIDLTFKNSDSHGAVVFGLLTPEVDNRDEQH